MPAKKPKKVVRMTKKSVSASKKISGGVNKKLSAISKAFTKSEIISNIATLTDLAQKQVGLVITALHQIIEGHVKKSGPGVFIMPGLLKVQVVTKPATKARKGINPFTGEETTFKAKPARKVVKVKALKGLKEMV